MKNILFITSSFPYGFSEGFINAEIKALQDAGVNITVLPTYPRGELNPGNLKVNTINLPLFSPSYFLSFIKFFFRKPATTLKALALCIDRKPRNSLKNLSIIPKLCHFLLTSESKYDFALAYWASIPAQFAMLYSFITNREWAFTGHRWDLVERNNFDRKFKRARFVRLISRSGLDLLGYSLASAFRQKIRVVHLGVDVASTPDFSSSLRSKKIVCIANLNPVKGLAYLIEAVPLIDQSISLDIIGDGPLRKELSEKALSLGLRDRVSFLGAIPHSDVTALLQSGRYGALVLPSIDLGNGLHEGIPVVLMEAMSNGIPVISTNTGGIRELIGENSDFGICVTEKCSHELAVSITKLMSSETLRINYAKNGFRRVLETFNSNLNTARILELIEKK